jgi:hypothetical protein
MRWTGLASHLSEKNAVIVPTRVIDPDAAPAVISPLLMLRIETSIPEGAPSSIFWRPDLAQRVLSSFLAKLGGVLFAPTAAGEAGF